MHHGIPVMHILCSFRRDGHSRSSDSSILVQYSSWELEQPYKDNWRTYLDYDGDPTVKFTTILKREF